ncbi:ubiquinol-cytochrome-c reductase complex assembly factor 2 isoform X2 [Stomoxys calcitrans]|uniref:ubiquinol-cytochrome-c reductase complex assembly factor 2 isoform X2 n=1 Tax=Stomoxys calcitrans TaxID=35570 RepID=UPI0027E22476|nr:ubiquinol-cytochrome-c reductase complex assembly factor 2 isoform X2 [Stomoxys calcitrans]
MSAQYQRFLKVLEKWPADKSKVGRDLGEQIRKHIATSLANPASLTSEATDNVTKQIDSIERLANNTYGRKYRRIYDSTATGLSAQQCNQVLSSEFLQYLNEDSKKRK